MKLLLLVVTVLMLSGSGIAEELAEEDKSDIVLLHNEIRRRVIPPATNMADLVWDEELAMLAERYASTCSAVNPLYSDEQIDGIGANDGVANGPSYSVLDMVEIWGGQGRHYNYSCNSCAIGKCKRYKQLVYSEARTVGCAVQDCKGVAENTEQDYPIVLICLYDKKFSSSSRPYNSGLDVCIDCPEQEDCITAPTKPKDDEEEEKDKEDLYTDKDNIEECPPVCTTEYCVSPKKKLFNKACSLPGDPDCTISSCKACYFSKRKRVLPEGCEDHICPNWHNKSCLYKWARCIDANDQQPEEKKLKKFFKCYTPPSY